MLIANPPTPVQSERQLDLAEWSTLIEDDHEEFGHIVPDLDHLLLGSTRTGDIVEKAEETLTALGSFPATQEDVTRHHREESLSPYFNNRTGGYCDLETTGWDALLGKGMVQYRDNGRLPADTH